MFRKYKPPLEPEKAEKSQSEIFMEDEDFVMTQLKRHVLILQNKLVYGPNDNDTSMDTMYHQAIMKTLHEIEDREDKKK